ncbi:MAG: single-stranded DNA-binding protein [Desulfobacteraceae bacterium]|nr:single-stranded DNA-binding protein [Desulfobacteraceae bacterium]
MQTITRQLVEALSPLKFRPPVTHVYNPLTYAADAYDQYLSFYAQGPKEAVFVGMNPGPWGMAQTGIPFGEVGAVRDWLGITAEIGTPENMHPKRPVDGFACAKSEVSGRRFWGWARKVFDAPESFFKRFFVANYCPLIFFEASGRNKTPDKLKVKERGPLVAACNAALRETVLRLSPEYVIGIGEYARRQAQQALEGLDITIGRIAHPSPANPAANKGWETLITQQLSDIGIPV